MVSFYRQETSRIPHVVVAPKAGPQLPPGYVLPSVDGAYDDPDRSIYQNGRGDSRGYYHDGAYTAAPDYASSDEDEEEGELYDNQDEEADPTARNQAALSEAYFSSLIARFTALRSRLHQPPPPSAIDCLPPDHETEVGSFAPRKPTFRMWTHRIRYTDPLPAQVASMDKASVLRLLRVVLGGKFFRRGCVLRRRTSQWIWALLARLPDRGELDSDEVGAVRDLGKRAVLVSISREHVVALCEVLGRDQVVAFGLSGVLHEIEGRTEERKVDVDEDASEEVHLPDEDGRPANEDEIILTPDVDDDIKRHDAPPARPNDSNTAAETGIDLEDGEVPEQAESTPIPRPISAPTDKVDEEEVDIEMDIEEGEVSTDPSTDSTKEAALSALKARLLSDLDNVETWEEAPASPPAAAKKAVEDPVTDLANMRATVNMILTVAGEFYGQRDLLAFRDPFGDVPFETDNEDD